MLLVTLSIIAIILLNGKKEIKLDNVSLKESVSNSFALMLEQTNGTYEETTDTEWPSEGYSFNKHMSGCIDSNGNTQENTLTYKNGTIKLKTKHNTYCYIYFDIDRPATEELLATVPEEQLWDSTLEDDGYRYVGTNPDNYICFGTTDQKECMNDTDKYMYRIVGIFEDSEGQQHLKLIKKEALNTAYAWHSDYTTDTDWDESDLYKGINGEYFATNADYSYMQDSAWNNLITTWDYTATNTKANENYQVANVYGPYYYYTTTKAVYLHELNRNDKVNQICYFNQSTIADCNAGTWKKVNSKIGLMYSSDYLISLGVNSIEYITYLHKENVKSGWIHLSNNDIELSDSAEWTMSRAGGNLAGYDAWVIYSGGALSTNRVENTYSIRPVFYLESDTKLDKGSGTSANPYTIETSPNLGEYCEEYNNINECIKNEENNIEEVSDLWNSTLEEDGIRYVGTKPNNYICFGTTNANECTSDTDKYMYRIIGIFKDSEGKQHLKLIKKEALNTAYAWHSDYTTDTDWDESDLYKGINGSYFATNSEYSYMQDTNWINKISEWNYTAANTKTYENYVENNTYGPNYHYQVIKTTYLHELNRSSKTNCYYNATTTADCSAGEWKTVSAKIGLMYASDYQLSLGKTALDYTNSTHYSSMKTGWMHLSNNDSNSPNIHEWTMSRYGDDIGRYDSNVVSSDGLVTIDYVDYIHSARPVFYLTENIKITSGKGSITEPFIIN